MVYNITGVNATNTTLGFFQSINEITGPAKLLGNGWAIVLFVIIFFYILFNTNDMKKALLGSGTICFIIAGLFFLAANLVSWWIVVCFLVVACIGIIMSFDKDYGS